MRTSLFITCLCLSLCSVCLAQEWREYRLTNFTGQYGVGETAAVLDGAGNVHLYYSVLHMCTDSFNLCNDLMYMKVSPYGHILYGPVEIDDPNVPDQRTTGLRAVGDGLSRSWAV